MTRDTQEIARRALQGAIFDLRAELAVLERAYDELSREREHADQCDHTDVDSPCYGEIFVRWCADCGIVIRRCVEHGGLRGATAEHSWHRSRKHQDGPRHPEAANPPGLPAGGEALPMGKLQASPPARARGRDAASGQGGTRANDAPQRPAQGAAPGPVVQVRRRRGSQVD